MKIVGILQKNEYFYVSFKYNWLEKFMGHEDKMKVYMQTGKVYRQTQEPSFIDKEGNKLGCYDSIVLAIHNFKRAQIFNEESMNLNMN